MSKEERIWLLRETRANWKVWNDVRRGQSVVHLLEGGASRRALAKLIGCSEGLIRNMEMVGKLPYHWKQYLIDGQSTRKVLAAWRARYGGCLQ